LLDCTNLNCVEIYVGILEEEESGVLILYNSSVIVLYVILDRYKTGAWKEKIIKLYQSKLCSNLRRRRNLESNKSNLI
jgi:hypothetical protein